MTHKVKIESWVTFNTNNMTKTYYDVEVLSVSGDIINIKGLTNSSLNSLSHNIDTIQRITITKQYDKKIK